MGPDPCPGVLGPAVAGGVGRGSPRRSMRSTWKRRSPSRSPLRRARSQPLRPRPSSVWPTRAMRPAARRARPGRTSSPPGASPPSSSPVARAPASDTPGRRAPTRSGRSAIGASSPSRRSNLLALGRRYGRAPHWAVMTSPATDAETRAFFAAHACLRARRERVSFFVQAEMPCLDADGRLLLAAPDRLAASPDGHGGVVQALTRSGVLARLRDDGVEHLVHQQVDNPLCPVADPTLVGFRVRSGAEVASKVVSKRDPEDRVGTWIDDDGTVRVVEYTEFAEPERSERAGDGLRFWAGSINVHAFAPTCSRASPRRRAPRSTRRQSRSSRSIPTAPTRTPPPDPGSSSSASCSTRSPRRAGACSWKARREDEYAPVKNAEGGESPNTTRAALAARDARWCRRRRDRVSRRRHDRTRPGPLRRAGIPACT